MTTARLSVAVVVLAGVAGRGPAADAPAFPPDQLAFYQKDVRPVLAAHCLKCHGDDPKKVRGGLDLTTRHGLLSGGDTGPAIDPADPANSLLLRAVAYTDDDYKMPPAGKLADADLAVLRKWVGLGAPMPAGGPTAAVAHAKPTGPDPNYWAYRPVARPPVPAVRDAGWVRTPIDAFILHKLEAKGLAPVGPAGKAALVRRASYDLTGLPPSPERVQAFVADGSPGAYDRLVDELLASPHYGEKWGRHWLDVVRYAETNGFERDGPKPFAWKYRDYVIKSFNADKPYDRFVREQIAGDEVAPHDPDAVTATGFYRLGLWDDEPADKELAYYDGMDDLVTVVGQGFLAMTQNCNRCHDHKGDFFPQADYYKLVAFFRDVRPFSDSRDTTSPNNLTDVTPPGRRAGYEAELAARKARLAELAAAMAPIEDAAIKRLPPADQLAVDDGKREQVVKKVPALLAGDEKARYLELRAEYRALLRQPEPGRDLVLSVANCDPRPPATRVLVRGNPGAPGKEVSPGFPAVFGLPDPAIPPAPAGAKSAGRRKVLADWLAAAANPLTARVWVNRVWQHHFGRGLVPTPNDFGKLGEPCSHPELLDWLAAELTDPQAAPGEPWTVKRLHRLIMTSNVYRLAATATPAHLEADPSNVLRWRFDMRRLTAEEVRDTFLAAAGRLRLDLYGPSVFPKIPAEVLAGQSVPGSGWHYDRTDPSAADRRTVYVHQKRSLQVPVLAAHDQADTDSPCPVRYTTTVPTQALGLLNGEFAHDLAAAFAARLERECPGDLGRQVERAVWLTAGRPPAADELARDAEFVRAMKAKHGLDDATALARYALLLLNSNEFVYLD